MGTTLCNIGDQILTWTANNNQHPVIAQNMYRLKNGRFEQLGMSWVKHGWGALTLSSCCTCIDPNNFEALGVGCSDPYDSGLNGDQNGIIYNGNLVSGLGPRSEVNAATGAFLWPYGSQGLSGNAIYKRLQVHLSDLDPAQNAGALYFAESHYVTPNDAAAGNGNNNASYRRLLVGSLSGGIYQVSFSGSFATQQQKPAIQAWQDNDSNVTMQIVDVPGDGRFLLAYNCTNNGNGTWHYEYAIQNLNSDRSGHSFSIPIPAGVNLTNIGFHDVDYHSGEPYDLTDWSAQVSGGAITWAGDTFQTKPNANALRWATLYNFRFDADAPPTGRLATLGLFKPPPAGGPTSMSVSACGPVKPGDITGDGVTNVDDLLAVINGWGPCPAPPRSCPADIAPAGGNGQVNVDDLLKVINNWG